MTAADVIRQLFGMDVRRFLDETHVIDPSTVDCEAVAVDLYQECGTTDIEAIPSPVFWGAVFRHHADPEVAP